MDEIVAFGPGTSQSYSLEQWQLRQCERPHDDVWWGLFRGPSLEFLGADRPERAVTLGLGKAAPTAFPLMVDRWCEVDKGLRWKAAAPRTISPRIFRGRKQSEWEVQFPQKCACPEFT
jgi:hypothetical protein